MRLSDAADEARRAMDAHGLTDWKFEFDESRKFFGRCWHDEKKITLSRRLVALNDARHTRNTIYHEIAHALAGYGAGHGPIWQAMAMRLGAVPRRCYGPEVKRPPAVTKVSFR